MILAGLVFLAGCTGSTAPSQPTGSAATGSPGTAVASPPSATPAARIALVPDGTAQQNLPVFRRVTEKVWASSERASGRAYVDALVKAGFAKSRMQVTEDLSTVGNPAESIQFSVLWKDGQCLVGQVGPSTGDPVTKVLAGLPGKTCLIGKTRPINW